MRIYGADSFAGTETSLNAIQANYLENDDCCFVKVNTVVYFYRLKDDSGLPQSIPDVIAPKFNFIGPSIHPTKRWLLCDIFTNVLNANLLKTNNILPLLSGNDIVICDGSVRISGVGIRIDGQMEIKTDNLGIPGDYPPLVVDNNVLVKNLNAEYLNGHPAGYYVFNKSHDVGIPLKADNMTVTFDAPLKNTGYSIIASISNNVDTDPSIYGIVVSNQTTTSFKVKFSGKIDSVNYKLNYLILGDVFN